MNQEGWLSFATEAKNKKKVIKTAADAGATFLKEVLNTRTGCFHLYFYHSKLYDKKGNVRQRFYQIGIWPMTYADCVDSSNRFWALLTDEEQKQSVDVFNKIFVIEYGELETEMVELYIPYSSCLHSSSFIGPNDGPYFECLRLRFNRDHEEGVQEDYLNLSATYLQALKQDIDLPFLVKYGTLDGIVSKFIDDKLKALKREYEEQVAIWTTRFVKRDKQ